jgi:hypothetical protein
MKTSATIDRRSFFKETQKPTGIIIPDHPIYVQANCAQKGQWILGEKSLGNEFLNFFVLAVLFSREFNPYKSKDIPIATIFLTPIDNEILKAQLVYAIKIRDQDSGRKGSLSNFASRTAEMMATGIDPREVVWTAKFVNKSGTLPNGLPYNCAVIDFDYRYVKTDEEDAILGDCILVLEEDLA